MFFPDPSDEETLAQAIEKLFDMGLLSAEMKNGEVCFAPTTAALAIHEDLREYLSA